MVRQFYIYKKGFTQGKICILSKVNERFDFDAKVKKYQSLNYKVYTINNIEIR